MNINITGTGIYLPAESIRNQRFEDHHFYEKSGQRVEKSTTEVIEKFSAITGIRARRYLSEDLKTSEVAALAGREALEDAGIDPETLDGIIVAHNFGDIEKDSQQSDLLPSLASRVKHALGIAKPECVAYDIIFGCPGWVQGLIIARNYILAGEGSCFLIIGAEALSRVLDPYDRDSMIYADGAGAAVVERKDEKEKAGILSVASQTFAREEAYYLHYGVSYRPDVEGRQKYIKMDGRKIYEFALTRVPQAMKLCLDKSGVAIEEVKKILIHQANEKMDEAIVQRFYRLYKKAPPKDIMPMTIGEFGNSSVATVPTLLDMLFKGNLKGHHFQKGDVLLLASVGAGMNINAITYRV